jgi:hypothetical protein
VSIASTASTAAGPGGRRSTRHPLSPQPLGQDPAHVDAAHPGGPALQHLHVAETGALTAVVAGVSVIVTGPLMPEILAPTGRQQPVGNR